MTKQNPAAQVGGKRPGAGRKPGVQNKITEKAKKRALRGGPSMLDIMVSMARELYDDWLKYRELPSASPSMVIKKANAALEAAAKAAPYLHSKLLPVSPAGPDGETSSALRVIIVNDPDADS